MATDGAVTIKQRNASGLHASTTMIGIGDRAMMFRAIQTTVVAATTMDDRIAIGAGVEIMTPTIDIVLMYRAPHLEVDWWTISNRIMCD